MHHYNQSNQSGIANIPSNNFNQHNLNSAFNQNHHLQSNSAMQQHQALNLPTQLPQTSTHHQNITNTIMVELQNKITEVIE